MPTVIRFVLFCLLVSPMAACINTPIRRSAFVPRPTLPAHNGAPIGEGGIKGFAQVNSLGLAGTEIKSIEDLIGQIPFEGAAGLWVPKLQLGAGVYGSTNDIVEIGAQASYTRLEWAKPNVLGVLEFPEEHSNQQMIMGGPGVRINVPVGEPDERIITPAIILEANIATVPQAVYLRRGDGAVIDEEGNVVVPTYDFVRIDRETFILPTLAAHVTVSPIEYLHVLVMGGVQRGVKNIGFDPNIENLENSSLTGYFYGIAGGGLEGRYQTFYGTALLSSAFGQPREIRFGLQATFSLGVVFH